MKLRDNFIGTGSMKEFCQETNLLFEAANNIVFIMPSGYSGVEPTGKIELGQFILDMGDAQVFTLNNVVWNLTGTANFTSNSVTVTDGKLVISVNADNS